MRRLVLAALAAVLGLRAVYLAVAGLGRPAHGFVAHYAASRVVLEGQPPALLYDDDWFGAQVRRFEPTVADLYGPNLPSTSLIFLPLAMPTYPVARAAWTFASLAGLVALMLWVARSVRLSQEYTAVLLGFALVAQPVSENLFHAQMYVFGLGLVVFAWQGLRRSRSWQLGAGIGFLLAAKSAGLMYWPWLAVRRCWRAFGWAAATVAIVCTLTVPIFHAAGWAAYARTAWAWMSRPSLSLTAYQTLEGFAKHLLVYDARWNPHPFLRAAWAGQGLSVVVVVAALTVSTVAARRGDDNDMAIGAFTLLSLICSPVSVDYHYTLALFPIALLFGRLQHAMASREGLLLVLGALLIGADLPYRSARLADGLWAVLGYPKLYGALILWGLLLSLSRARIRTGPGLPA
jgi:hypothetical protein